MKVVILILSLLISTLLNAQRVVLTGTIVDAQTSLPIPGATINIAAKKLYYPTDNRGRFKISNDSISSKDSIKFSCIGYQAQTFVIGNISVGQLIKLQPITTMLKEVRVGIISPNIVSLGSKVMHEDFWKSTLPNFELAMYMTGSKSLRGIIRSVGFYLGNGGLLGPNKGGDVTAPFRIRFYDVDTSGQPGKELTNETIIVSGKKNSAWFDVDVSAYHIQNPENGFFVSFGLLNQEFYTIKKGYENVLGGADDSKHDATPRLGMIDDKLKRNRCFDGSVTYWGWEWRNTETNWGYGYMIRATVESE